MKQEQIYELLPEDEKRLPETESTLQTSTKRACVLLTITLIVILVSIFVFAENGPAKTENAIWNSCGTSIPEARDQDCVLDVMNAAWVKKDCYPKSLSEEFLVVGDYPWYTDEEGKNQVSLKTIQDGDFHHFYTTDDYHFDHCVYVWRLQNLAYQTRSPVDNTTYSFEHTHHCSTKLRDEIPAPRKAFNQGAATLITPIFTSCGPYWDV